LQALLADTKGVAPPQAVLVTDAETRAVVAACRGLAYGGFRVTAAAGSPGAVSHWSRSCHRRLHVPHPVDAEAGFIDALERAVRDDRHAVLLPGGDASLVAISRHRERLEPYVRLGLPSHEVVLRVLDKVVLGEAARAAGLPTPEAAVCSGIEEAVATARRFEFPVILKAVQSVFTVNGETRRSGSVRVEDEDSLRALVPEYGEPCLLQRSLPGAVLSFAGVMAGSELLAMAVSRYRRTWYPEAGNACFSETTEPAPELRERLVDLMSGLGWEGIFELELIERPDGSWAAIDLNPRLYGSMALAVAAKANLPAIWCRHVLGERTGAASARLGFRYRWEDADLRHLLLQASRGRVREAAAVLRPRRRVAHAHFRLDDPGPLAARAVYLARVARRRGNRVPQVTTEPDVRDPAPRPGGGPAPEPVAVIGAGPYGLAAASHLRHAGIRVHAFGEPLEFWRTRMPTGMILRSRKRSSHIADPERALTIDHFEAAEDRKVTLPSLRLEEFVDYGVWYQRQAVPDLDPRRIEQVERQDGGFRLRLEDGDEVPTRRVVLAAGLFPFAYRPEPFASLPQQLVSHSSDHDDLRVFSGRRVLVVGAGQSALESAALLAETGADVQIVARTPQIYWLADGGPPVRQPPIRSRLPKPPTDVGGFATGWTAATPDLFRRMPRRLQPEISYRCIRPAGSGWLRPRLENVPMEMEAAAVQAEAANGQVRVGLADGSDRLVDHVLLGTGFQIDVRRYPFLGAELAKEIETVAGYPRLRPGLETSVDGLHIIGAPAAATFGPIMRFVVGTWYAAPALTRRILGRRQKPLSFSF
jgi:predicted ATP-grasp superfamily ATP-dependent carboligase